MGRPFWTVGAVPAGLLDDLALPRPDALATVVATLREGRMALIGGPRGCGRTTLALQAAAALQRGAILIDGPGIDHPATCATRVAQALGSREDPDHLWSALKEAGRPVIILDAVDSNVADEFSKHIRRADTILIGESGPTPDAISDDNAKAFLQRRSHRAGISWSQRALDQATDMARGQVDALQWIGHACLAESFGKTQIDADAVLEGAAVAAEHLPSAYASALVGLQGARLELLKAITRRPREGPSAWARLADIPVNAASVHLLRLVDSGLVERVGRGSYRIQSPLVALHLQGRYGNVAQLIPAP